LRSSRDVIVERHVDRGRLRDAVRETFKIFV
jgi:hypothetical protein